MARFIDQIHNNARLREGTVPLTAFSNEHSRINFLKYIVGKISQTWIEHNTAKLPDHNWQGITDEAFKTDMWHEMMLCRHMENFECYLSALMTLVYQSHPEIMSGLQVDIAVVLKHQDRDELIKWMIESKVQSLSRENFHKLSEAFEKRFGLTLIVDRETLNAVAILSKFRNLIVHNRGYVDHKFLNDMADMKVEHSFQHGEKIRHNEKWDEWCRLLLVAAYDLDQRAMTKWNLPRKPVYSMTTVTETG